MKELSQFTTKKFRLEKVTDIYDKDFSSRGIIGQKKEFSMTFAYRKYIHQKKVYDAYHEIRTSYNKIKSQDIPDEIDVIYHIHLIKNFIAKYPEYQNEIKDFIR